MALNGVAQTGKQVRASLVQLATDETTDAAYILTHVENMRFQKYVDDKDEKGMLKAFNTVIHESCHRRNSLVGVVDHGDTCGFFLTRGVEIKVFRDKVYNSNALSSFVADSLQKQIFRYSTYVGDESMLATSSVPQGIYGMMDEIVAYYHGTKACLELYDYYYKNRTNGFEDKWAWTEYISNIASTHYAYYEFKLFISWYLQYAQLHHPDVYEACMQNTNLRVVYTLIDDSYAQLMEDYYLMLHQLVKDLSTADENVSLALDDGELMFTVSGNGSLFRKPIWEDDLAFLKQLLEGEEHAVLETFRIDGVTLKNYKEYLK